jgi:DUF1707 SHOCT-like domain
MDEVPGRGENRAAAGAPAPLIRASDGDREAVAARLNQAVGDGRLTLEEFGSGWTGRMPRARAAHWSRSPLTYRR